MTTKNPAFFALEKIPRIFRSRTKDSGRYVVICRKMGKAHWSFSVGEGFHLFVFLAAPHEVGLFCYAYLLAPSTVL